MATLLKVMVIILLVLSIVALGLGLKLFSSRTELKDRTKILQSNVLTASKYIEAKDGEDLVTKGLPTMDTVITENQLQSYYTKDASGRQVTGAPGTLEPTLKSLVNRAKTQYDRLNDTRSDLEQTRTTLATTKTEKEKVEGDLAAEKKVTKEQGEKIDTQTKDIEAKTTKIAELDKSNTSLQEKVDGQTKDIAKLTDENKDLAAKTKAQDADIKSLNRKIAILVGDEKTGLTRTTPGYKGQVLILNSAWNFVILGITKDADLMPNVDLIVHRDDHFVGKVRVTEIKPEFNIAVADILPEWSKGKLEEGDNVIF